MTGMWCRRCGLSRLPSELVEVIAVRDGGVFYVCRPSIKEGCFVREVGTISEHAIASPDTGR